MIRNWIVQASRKDSARDIGEAELGPAEWVRTKLGFIPDPIQARLLESSSKRVILNCTRQWGKSTVTAAKAVHLAATRRDSLILVVSPGERQSGEFLRKAAGFMRRLGMKVKGDGDNAMSLAFRNGSRIVGLPGKEATIRGFSAVSLLVVDEAARVPDDMYMAIRPMLAVSNGTLWLMSTPHGKTGFFHETWMNGGEAWERVKVTAEECPRISKEHLKEETRALGARWYRQEYMCEFEDTESGVFDMASVRAAFKDDIKPLVIP